MDIELETHQIVHLQSKKMDTLPNHGRIDCTKCFASTAISFDETRRTEGAWRITANPLAWGNPLAEVVVLGFSKGPTQAGALANAPHDEIAYKGSRAKVAKILSHIGVMSVPEEKDSAEFVNEAIADRFGKFHFGSLIRCTVERFDNVDTEWKGSGGGMLDRFVATPFGREVAQNCTKRFLSNIPKQTKLVVMFGLGTKLNYVRASFELYRNSLGGEWTWLNEVSYTDGNFIVVHVEHFASRGSLIPNWMGEKGHKRGAYSRQAREAVVLAKVGDQKDIKYHEKIGQREDKSSIRKTRLMNQHLENSNTSKFINKNEKQEVLAEILATVKRADFQVLNENKKLAELRSPSGRTIYLIKTNAKLNSINVIVHPDLSEEELRKLPGSDSVGSDYRFHSNMPKFPMRLHNGKSETTFGRQIKFGTLGGLTKFLSAFDRHLK